MLRQRSGATAVAEAVARCRPGVVSAYPVPPQARIAEDLATLVKSGALAPCEYLDVESGPAALAAASGAAAAGVRAYTTASGQALLSMAEALFHAAGLGLPIVMTVANRAVGAPIGAGNDHSDAMSQRDSGWVQLYARDNQHAVDLHIQAFRLAEELSVPVQVCVDGFVLTHAVEPVDVPGAAAVDAWLPPFRPRLVLDPDVPVTIGAAVGPDAFTEVRYLTHQAHQRALERIPSLGVAFATAFGRPGVELVEPYACAGADLVVVALGSVLGTVKDVVDDLRADGLPVGALGLTTYRPFPSEALRAALAGVGTVVVLERAFSAGAGGIVSADLAAALTAPTPERAGTAATAGAEAGTAATAGAEAGGQRRFTVVAGLGGRPITLASLRPVLVAALAGALEPLTFLGLDHDVLRAARDRHAAAATHRTAD